MDREKQIVRASIMNVIGNALIAVAKGAAGAVTGSVAIMLDALNSLTDALGSVIAIIGTKIAGRSANHNHPFGFGRMEYVTSIVIAALILSAGVSAFTEAVRSILHPTTPQYSFVPLAIVAISACVKFGLGFFLRRKGAELDSDALVGSGTDSLMDGGVSAATFSAGIIYITTGIAIESLLAAGIAVLIIKSGAQLLLSTVSKLLGERVSADVSDKVEQTVRGVEGVRFASGLVLLDFGPDNVIGAIHITVDDQMTVTEFDAVARQVRSRVEEECGITLAGITPYPDTSDDESLREVHTSVSRIVWRHDEVLELRGLYANAEERVVRFDAVVGFDVKDFDKLRQELVRECLKACPEWGFDVRVLPSIAD